MKPSMNQDQDSEIGLAMSDHTEISQCDQMVVLDQWSPDYGAGARYATN